MVLPENGSNPAAGRENGHLLPELLPRDEKLKFSPQEKALLAAHLECLWRETNPNPETSVMSFAETGIQSGYYPDDGFWTKKRKGAEKGVNHVYVEIPDGLNEKTSLREVLSLSQQIRAVGSATAIIPNILGLRSDRPIYKKEDIELSAIPEIIDLLKFLHVERLITLDTHSPAFSYEATKNNIAILDLTAIPTMLQEAINKDLLDNPCFVAADGGGYEMAEFAKEFAIQKGIELDAEEPIIKGNKTRVEGKTKPDIVFDQENLNRVNGRTVVITEDIISSGGTLTEVVEKMLVAGAKNVVILATFGVFAEGSVEKLQALQNTRIIITDAREPLSSIENASNITMISVKDKLREVAKLDQQGIDFWSPEGQTALARLDLALAPWQTHHGYQDESEAIPALPL